MATLPSPQVLLSAAASKHAGVSPRWLRRLGELLCSPGGLLAAPELPKDLRRLLASSGKPLHPMVWVLSSANTSGCVQFPLLILQLTAMCRVGWKLVSLAAAELRQRREVCWRYVGCIQSRLSSIFLQPWLPCPCLPAPLVAFPRRSLGTAAVLVFPSLAAPRASPWRSPAVCSSHGVCFGGWRKLQSACLIISD